MKVINSSASPVKRVVVIDKGKNDGIFIGQNVIGTKGLVGLKQLMMPLLKSEKVRYLE